MAVLMIDENVSGRRLRMEIDEHYSVSSDARASSYLLS